MACEHLVCYEAAYNSRMPRRGSVANPALLFHSYNAIINQTITEKW